MLLTSSAAEVAKPMEPWMLDEVVRLVAEHGTVPPPWVMHNEHPYSMRWRMGDGEGHREVWWAWWPQQGFTEQQKIEYFRKWPPPHCWLAFLIEAVWGVDTFEERDNVAATSTAHAHWASALSRSTRPRPRRPQVAGAVVHKRRSWRCSGRRGKSVSASSTSPVLLRGSHFVSDTRSHPATAWRGVLRLGCALLRSLDVLKRCPAAKQ